MTLNKHGRLIGHTINLVLNVSSCVRCKSAVLGAVPARLKHTLPDMPYDYGALEPYISAEIMQLHHSKHHAAYVNNLNIAEEKLAEAEAKGKDGLRQTDCHWYIVQCCMELINDETVY